MNDPELDDLLRSARGNVPLPDSFRQGVWHRIESESLEGTRRFAWLENVFGILIRPQGALLTMAAVVTLGLWLGASTAPKADSKTAYVESISPFAGAHGK